MDYRNHPQLRNCARAITQGAVVAYPTEAVWGLGCDPFNRHAVQEILSLKQRPEAKGLILAAASITQLDFLLHDLDPKYWPILHEKWPGPWTFLVPHRGRVPRWVTGEHDSVAVRVSAHPVVKALCELSGSTIVSTSANPQAKPPARYGYTARRYFGDRVSYAPGQVNLRASPSRICDLITGQIIRP